MTESLELAVLSDVVSRLQSAGFDYMITGSVAMNYYAEPRMTRDIDIVVALTDADADTIMETFEGDYYLSRDAVVRAIHQHRIFNLVHYQSVVKVDLIVRKESEYRRAEFDRRQQIRVDDLVTWIVSKEDLILSKLSWAQDSRSELQLNDVRNLLASGPDMDYLNKWSTALGLHPLLRECLNE
jgi:hypothetical protein